MLFENNRTTMHGSRVIKIISLQTHISKIKSFHFMLFKFLFYVAFYMTHRKSSYTLYHVIVYCLYFFCLANSETQKLFTIQIDRQFQRD